MVRKTRKRSVWREIVHRNFCTSLINKRKREKQSENESKKENNDKRDSFLEDAASKIF
jgi:hypothetical protein